MIVTFDIGARFSFLWRVLYLLFLVNICRTAKTGEEGGGGGREGSTQRGCSPLMGLVACWLMVGLFEL